MIIIGVIGVMLSPAVISNAATKEMESNKVKITQYSPIVDSSYNIIEGDKVICFHTKEDYDIYKSAKASSYTLTKGKTYSATGSYSYKGFTISTGFSYSSSVATTISADASRYSKLGTWGDFEFQYCKYIETQYGQPTGRVSYGVEKRMTDHYIGPKYQ